MRGFGSVNPRPGMFSSNRPNSNNRPSSNRPNRPGRPSSNKNSNKNGNKNNGASAWSPGASTTGNGASSWSPAGSTSGTTTGTGASSWSPSGTGTTNTGTGASSWSPSGTGTTNTGSGASSWSPGTGTTNTGTGASSWSPSGTTGGTTVTLSDAYGPNTSGYSGFGCTDVNECAACSAGNKYGSACPCSDPKPICMNIPGGYTCGAGTAYGDPHFRVSAPGKSKLQPSDTKTNRSGPGLPIFEH